MNQLKVALSGKRFSGKTTAAKVFQHFGFHKVSLADPLKQEVAIAHGIPLHELAAAKESYRAELQRVGQERRAQDPDFWVTKLLLTADLLGEHNLVLDDLRFRNEAGKLQRAGWQLVRLLVGPTVQYRRGMALTGAYDEALDQDVSETDLDNWSGWDVVLDANDPFPIFENKVQLALGRLLVNDAESRVIRRRPLIQL